MPITILDRGIVLEHLKVTRDRVQGISQFVRHHGREFTHRG